jgi:hypothetical protein
MDGLNEVFDGECIQNLIRREPTASRHGDAITKISQAAGRVSVGGHDEFDTALAGRANPARLEVETFGIAVNFDGPRL